MANITERKDRYFDGFALTKYTMPVVRQMSGVIPGGFFIYKENETRELIYANQKVFDIYGCADLSEFKELTGYTFEGMVHPDDFRIIQDSIDSQIDSDEGDSFDHVEYRIIKKDGEVRWVDDFGHYGYSPEYGDVYYVFISDITERKKAQERHEQNKKILKNIADILSGLDSETEDFSDDFLNKLKSLKEEICKYL